MADRISTLPEAVLCHILSFLPTKQVVATSLLSKRWKPLWLSVPTLDFDDKTYLKDNVSYYRFVQSVYAVILSRHLHQPIQTFRLWCQSSLCESTNINIWVNAALQRRVEHLNLHLPLTFRYEPYINLLSPILSHKTLVVLKLRGVVLITLSSIDLPSLKILHLNFIRFLEPRYLAELLSGCPVLEDLEANALRFENSLSKGEFKRLPNLLRANILTRHIPLDVVSNVEFLRINKVEDEFGDEVMDTVNEEDAKQCVKNFIPVFHKLIHIELNYFDYIKDWLHVVEVLKNSPKLQNLILNQDYCDFFEQDEEGDWACPQSVPKSVSLQLKTCRVNNYKGSKAEFQFASYIMRNARMLQNMTICSHADVNRQRKLKMIKKLCLCKRRSAKCKLTFK